MTKIAIVIPSYNESENLENLINEINSNLKNVEIFIIDDSDVDYSDEILKNKNNVHFFTEEKNLEEFCCNFWQRKFKKKL